MQFDEFKQSLSAEAPPDTLTEVLQALWYEKKNNWEKAHHLVQDLSGRDAALVHAYLHRKEGDLSNAAYWYNRAGASLPHESTETEWEAIVRKFLS